MGRIQPGDVWSFKDWAVLFTDGEAALEEVRIAYAQAQKSVTIHSYIADADRWLANEEHNKREAAALVWRHKP